jgi:hypothetical protein
MAMSDDSARTSANVPMAISLTPTAVADLSHLTPLERKQLIAEHTAGMLNLARKAQELHMDVGVLKAALGTLSDATQEVAQSGNSVTISHTQTSSVGRTEILMGNTGRAESGKLTASQTGQKDWTPYYIFAGLIALVLIASAVFGHH